MRRGEDTLTLAVSRLGPALPPRPCCCASSTASQAAPPYCDACPLAPPLPATAGSGAGLLPAAGSSTRTLLLLLPLVLPAAERALPADACCIGKADSSCSWMHAVLERTGTSSALLSALASIKLAWNLHTGHTAGPCVWTGCPPYPLSAHCGGVTWHVMHVVGVTWQRLQPAALSRLRRPATYVCTNSTADTDWTAAF